MAENFAWIRTTNYFRHPVRCDVCQKTIRVGSEALAQYEPENMQVFTALVCEACATSNNNGGTGNARKPRK